MTDASRRPVPGQVHGVPPRRWALSRSRHSRTSLVHGARIERVMYVLEKSPAPRAQTGLTPQGTVGLLPRRNHDEQGDETGDDQDPGPPVQYGPVASWWEESEPDRVAQEEQVEVDS